MLPEEIADCVVADEGGPPAGVLKQGPFYAIHEDDVEDRRGESSIEGGVSAAGG